MTGFFITGTDTEVGKTYVTVRLINALKRNGLRVAGMKPVASGAEKTHGQWMNDDAIRILQAASVEVPYELVNPYCFEPAVAPHIAAKLAGVEIDPQVILQAYTQLAETVDIVIVEGVGGWCVPLSDKLGLPSLAKMFSLPVILVVGLRLGCLNHAKLTADRIQQDGLELAGWIANHLADEFSFHKENLQTLEKTIAADMLTELAYGAEEFEPGKIYKLLNVR